MALRDLFDRPATAPTARPTAPQPQAPGTRIGYDPLLLDQLRRDHRKMLDLFAVTQALLITHDYAGVQRKLGEFRVMLQDHMLTANTKLYIYVSRQLSEDAVYSSLINTVRRELLDNSRQIMEFLRTYSAMRLDDNSAQMFQTELISIGEALMQRIEREESSLFPLYQAKY
jgi:regulator of sigma D